MIAQSDFLMNSIMRTKQDKFLDQLGTYTLIDIGIIDSVDSEGRAQVSTCRFSGARQVTYNNVEIVYPGNTGGAYTSACAGTSCLIFIPYSCMPDITSQKMRVGSSIYSKDGIKAMPISNGQSLKVSTLFDNGGNWYVKSDTWQLLFDEQFISLTQGDILSVTKDLDGAFHFYYKGENSGDFTIDVTDEGITKKYNASDGSVKWLYNMDTAGVASFSQTNSDDEVLSSLQIAADGATTINVGKATVSIDSEGKITIDSSHDDGVSVTIPNKVAFSIDDEASISTSGKLAISSEDALDIKASGKLSISSDDEISIKAGSGKQVKVNGTNLTVD